MNLPDIVLAVGALGTASFALVDAFKVLPGGGPSRIGFGHVRRVLKKLLSSNAQRKATEESLVANWINGTALADQKSIAKTLIKLKLDETTAPAYAAATHVSAQALAGLATKYTGTDPLTDDEKALAGRFDLMLSTLIDEGYQRADRNYRNASRLLAIVIAVVLAYVANMSLAVPLKDGQALLIGLLAAPLAPISKDLASALQAAVKALQSARG